MQVTLVGSEFCNSPTKHFKNTGKKTVLGPVLFNVDFNANN